MPRFARLVHVSAALLPVALLSAAAAPALAGDKEGDLFALDTITVTASSETVALSRTGTSVTVITAETLDTAPLSFGALLSRTPGVTLTANGGTGTTTDLRIRGLQGYYLGTRIDGIDVSDPAAGQLGYDFGPLTTEGLSRIEVLRGAQSALYGSEVIGGVIDITTWRPEDMSRSGTVSLEAGSYGTLRAAGSVGVRTERSELALSFSRTLTDGFSASALGTEPDGFRGSQLSASARHQLTETLSLGANLIAQTNHSEFDGTAGDTANWVDKDMRGARVFARFETDRVMQELSWSGLRNERVYSYGSVFLGERESLAYSGRWTAGPTLSLNWGADHTEETRQNTPSDDRIASNAVFTEALWAASESLDLSLALRHDHHSMFGGQNSGRLGLAWRPGADWVIRGVAATGFRAPSAYELYSAYGSTAFKPEESRSFELGAERQFASGALKATLFDTRIENKIAWDGTATSCSSFVSSGWAGCFVQTPGTTRSRGVEIEGEVALGQGWEVTGSYTYADVEVTDAGVTSRAARAPRHVLSAGLSRDFASGWSLSASARHVSDRYDTLGATLVAMPDYTVADVAVSYDISEDTRAWLRIENLFDETYQTVRTYAQPGRAVYLGVGARF